MSIIDKNLARTAYSGINYDNILRDIITIIQNDPNYTFDMEDFTSSNAGRMILELYAYIGDQLATRLDWYVNENFLPTATQRESVIKILRLIGYKLSLAVSSSVDVTLTPKSNLGEVSTLTSYTPAVSAPSFYPFSLTAQGLDGSTLNFEALYFNTDTQEFEYKNKITYSDSVKSLTFWEGTTIVEDFIVETTNNQIFYLTHPNVTKNSIQVYKVITQDDGNTVEEKKLTYVNSFLERNAQKIQTTEDREDIPYTYNLEGNTVNIEFAPISLIPRATKRPSLGDRIRVFYRVGGGENTNIVKKAINTTLPIEGDDSRKTVQISFINQKAATGGQNEETSEHAKEYAPLTIRAQDRTVNEEDYITIGKDYDKVYKIKTYGVKNLDAEEVYERYGEYIKPLEAWNYILCKNNGYQDLKNNEYNKFRWITQDYENRFNEKYGFSKGAFNYNLGSPEIVFVAPFISDEEKERENDFKNYFSFNIDANLYMKAKLSKTETPSDIKKFVSVYNIFNDFIRYGAEDDNLSVERVFQPQRTSVDLSGDYKPSQKFLSVDIDNNEFYAILQDNDNYVQYNVDIINNAIGGETPEFPARIEITSENSILEQGTLSESSEETSMTFTIKVDEIEKEISVPMGADKEAFTANFITAISDGFSIDTSRIEIVENKENEDIGPYTTTISIKNESEEQYFHFIKITYYPSQIGFIKDKVYGGGNYETVAFNIDNKYIVLRSPNTGEFAKVGFDYREDTDTEQYCTGTLFDIDNFNEDREVYGYQKLTFIPGINRFYFENGFFDYKTEKDDENNVLNDKNFYLNYLTEENEEIEFGNYASIAFSEDNPSWREPATRIYNTIYNTTDVDYRKSIPIIKFSYNSQTLISLYQEKIDEIIYDNDKKLTVSDSPCVEFNWDSLTQGKQVSIGIDIEGISPFNNDEENKIIFTSSNSQSIHNFITIEKQISAAQFVLEANSELRQLYGTIRMPVYSNFNYAFVDTTSGENIIKIYSPTRSINSNVCLLADINNEQYVDIQTANNDYCLTYKYKPVYNYGVNGFRIKTKKDELKEEITVGDTLLYGTNIYYSVKKIEEDVNDPGFIYIIIGESGKDPEVNWDNAPEIFYFTNNILYLQKISDNFPDLEFYVNYIADKRFVPGVYEKYSEITEEEELKKYLDKYKILAIENVFKQPIINTFDVSGIIYYNSRLYTEDFVKKSVTDALKAEFSLDNMDFGESIKKSKVLSAIQNLTCVQWVDLKYIRRSYNYSEEEMIDNEIPCNFDEILIISDDYYEDETSVKHGLLFEYTSEN